MLKGAFLEMENLVCQQQELWIKPGLGNSRDTDSINALQNYTQKPRIQSPRTNAKAKQRLQKRIVTPTQE